MKVSILDLGVGNLHSLAKAIRVAAPAAIVQIEPEPARAFDRGVVVLPGVGAFAPAAARLAPTRLRLREALEAGAPCIGICLGMQLLFDGSDEGPGAGVGFFGGRVTRLSTARAPHMGWSGLEVRACAPAWPWPSAAYYAHSFACRGEQDADVVATTTLDGDRVVAAVRRRRTVGMQFHPEKSSRAGIRLLAAVLDEVAS